ncbi:CRISPR-associated endonuclease Cas2 [Candidatus Roizmanbacteria bacterium CG17_big_fil_post_rev_8_21_14_2_50_39_7]|uniref:CRISPR-associated endonuclease Cas2 n=1 Tax=Candidatus Roizmanbacteria bacterium CG17_big_fil_post_rev_8_21_14_2_50_39_7 TaxID=1974858 RepID=A0A2M7EK49_9BACT|nr:MAG: CRISPR-associated endonuclease Cas2 [Candidatus Roizmanbacteria bacterium CG17_big_fil_post_rev_8_21_14_2_50_39_7]
MKMKYRKPKRGELYWEILKVIGLACFGGSSITRPIMPLAITEITRLLRELRSIEVDENKIKRSLVSLEKKEIISLTENGSDVSVMIKNRNHPVILKYSVKSFLDFKKKERKWNGNWFLVFFDVPEIQRNKRNYLRKFLLDLGFYRYQQSVYLFPYACEEEITLIKQIVEGASYMKYIIAEKIEDEEQAKKHFHLS